MKIITEIAPKLDGTQFYRGIGPLNQMVRQESCELHLSENLTWGEIGGADTLFLLRPCLDKHVKAVEYAKSLGMRVWIDYDDNLLKVPSDNPSHSFYSNREIQKNIRTLMALATTTTVSTNALKEALGGDLSPAVQVIPNALDSRMFSFPQSEPPQGKTVLWRGTNTHVRDLMAFKEGIIDIIESHPEVNFLFCGYDPWFITEGRRNAISIEGADLVSYFKSLRILSPDIMIVPLDDSIFNRCKSNIAALEGAYAGAVSIVPDWEEWDLPGVIKYGPEKGFCETLLQTLRLGRTELRYRAQQTFNEVLSRFTLESTSSLRMGAMWRN